MTLEELLRQGKSFGQGASNAAASTVTGPVDMLAWLLRKGGVPVGDTPIGGEAWMRQKGLMATPENRLAGLLGEGAGLAAPIVAAAKAPEIAGGLLQMGRNLAAPQTMNKQTGAIVYHGSPHKFDKFDSSKIGTGEGAQAYGHGLYLAENPSVAGQYADNVRPVTPSDLKRAKQELQEMLSDNWKRFNQDDIARQKDVVSKYQQRIDSKSIYKVDLPDEHIAKMLDLDSPIEKAPSAVQEYYKRVGAYKPGLSLTDHMAIDKNMAQEFSKAGIPGIRYLDGGSRGAGTGSSNFVVFPGNEGLLKILERNGGKP